MRLSILKHLRSLARSTIDLGVHRDADELIRVWETGAIHQASDFVWLEDTGFVVPPEPGHWRRVRKEIGRRQGLRRVKAREPRVGLMS